MTDPRFQAAALADRLIYGAPATFCAADALALLALVPRPGRWASLRGLLPAFTASATIPSAGMAGATPGGGSARMDGDARRYDFDLQGRQCLRAGQWRIYHEPGFLPGRHILALEQSAGAVETRAIIRFRRGRPVAMHREHLAPITLGPLSVAVATSRPWKRPA